MREKQISTGQAAKLTGLTIRTLQHYDNIGVLCASGRTEGGRRYYKDADLVNWSILFSIAVWDSLLSRLKKI